MERIHLAINKQINLIHVNMLIQINISLYLQNMAARDPHVLEHLALAAEV